MQEWYKPKHLGLFALIFIFFISFVNAVDNCKSEIEQNDVPCYLLLPYTSDCANLNFNVSSNNSFLYSETMKNYTTYAMCYGTFNQTGLGTYIIKYSSGDTGQIIVSPGQVRFYIYISSFILLFIFLIVGYAFKQDVMLYMAGFMSPIMALDIYNNGFPNISNVFLTQSVTIILTGMGLYYLVLPFLLWVKAEVL